MSKANIVLDATMLDTFQSCPAKYRYRFLMNKVPPVKAKPLDRGGLIHLGQEEYWKALANKVEYSDRVKIATQAMYHGSIESDLEPDEISWIIDCTLSSLERWRGEDESMTIKAVESPIIYLLHEDEEMKVYMMGKLDLIVDWKDYENLVVDHKSYERDFPLKRTANQFTNYANAISSNYVLVNRIGLQKSLKPEVKHKRIMLSYDPLFFEQWKRNVVQVCVDYLRYIAEGHFPMNFTSCDKFNRLCEYHDVCDTSGEENKVFKLNMHFNDAEVWDVSALLSGKKKKEE